MVAGRGWEGPTVLLPERPGWRCRAATAVHEHFSMVNVA